MNLVILLLLLRTFHGNIEEEDGMDQRSLERNGRSSRRLWKLYFDEGTLLYNDLSVEMT